MRRLGTALGFFLLRLICLLPLSTLRALGRGIGRLVFRFGRGRVALTNLRLCFPEMAEADRYALARRSFELTGASLMDLGKYRWGARDAMLASIRVVGREHVDALARQPVILLAPHFIGLNIVGLYVAHSIPKTCSMYSRQKNPGVEEFFYTLRSRFGEPVLVSRQEGLRGVVKLLKQGYAFYFLPDMDLGARDALFVPFFAARAATVTTLPRLAKLTGAKVVPAVARMTDAGYDLVLYPAWKDYPTADIEADVRRMNAFIEARVREMPEQYFWAHKRFKTRPPGERSPY